MIPFNLFEAADSSQNLHLTHIDEDIFERGVAGAQAGIDHSKSILDELGKGETKLTIKWDGAPAIFAGTDPKDGKFFVGTKSVFNKNPKIYKTVKDIQDNESGGKATKLIYALNNFGSIGIPKNTVLQGDLLWTQGDQKETVIDDIKYVTVHPNTIVYAWPAKSAVGMAVASADIGVVWHTTYTGRGDLSKYRAKFGADVSKLKKNRAVWMDDAYFKGVDVAFSDDEHKEAYGALMRAQKKVSPGFDEIVTVMSSLPSSLEGANVKTYINSKIRVGTMPSSKTALKEYFEHIEKYFNAAIDKMKSEKGIETKTAAKIQFMGDVKAVGVDLVRAFEYIDEMMVVKKIVIAKLASLDSQQSFVKTKDGYKATSAEGFVAINSKKGEAVKFVDRLAFSHFNFSDEYIKGWQK